MGAETDKQTFANPEVLNFYKSLPFNCRGSLEDEINGVLDRLPGDLYPGLASILNPHISILEVGCGVGWLANSISYLYNNGAVLGIDFNPVAISLAQEVVKAMGLKTRFQTEDLFLFEPQNQFDLVISFGVLHHTDNCAAAVRRLCRRFTRPGGQVMIGLYHTYGRRPFLDHFNEMKKRGASEQEMLARYRDLQPDVKDEVHLLSWFRDQVLNPHETQHTLEEMAPLLEDEGMELLSTSLNHFQPIDSVENVIREEKKYTDIAVQRLQNNQYFSGFFIFLARKKVDA